MRTSGVLALVSQAVEDDVQLPGWLCSLHSWRSSRLHWIKPWVMQSDPIIGSALSRRPPEPLYPKSSSDLMILRCKIFSRSKLTQSLHSPTSPEHSTRQLVQLSSFEQEISGGTLLVCLHMSSLLRSKKPKDFFSGSGGFQTFGGWEMVFEILPSTEWIMSGQLRLGNLFFFRWRYSAFSTAL